MIIAFEGINGCGKSTQINKVYEWIKMNTNCPVIKTYWNSYPGLEEFNEVLKDNDLLSPLSSSLIHALDFNLRYEQDMLPCLKMKGIVLADRYIYTAYVRDTIRGVSTTLLNEMYQSYPKADIILFFTISPEEAIKRIKNLEERSNYIVGMDLGLNKNKKESFIYYMKQQNIKYMDLFSRHNDKVFLIDATLDSEVQFEKIVDILRTLNINGDFKNNLI